MTQTVFPTFRYRDARAAIDWHDNTLGFEEARVYEGEGGLIEHAELSIAGNLVMLGSDRSEDEERYTTSRSVTYVAIEDPDALHERASSAGGNPTELVDQDYGSRDFSIQDPEGHTWAFGTYRPEP